MFIDEAEITIKGGHGGPGRVSFFPGFKSGPDGGNGGKGGNVFIKSISDLTALRQFTHHRKFAAENGEPGGSNTKSGKDGKDLVVSLPVGSLITDQETGESIELLNEGEMILVCKGGLGGRGNAEFKSSRNTTPEKAQPGLSGQEKHLHISLRLIAEYGLIGLPNVGKSSLLNELTKANVKTANYPFTTLEPSLGVSDGKVLADIPGLIEGASEGKGLGIKFLKHIEKTHKLLHCISVESDDVVADYKTVRQELKKFNPRLLDKEEIILLTKSDMADKKDLDTKAKKLKKYTKTILPVSIHDWDSLVALKKIL